ncbi:hypothetical protein Q5425_44665 [Amycolatopsis sp. A133]|uniref:hypothetical protein n=1 Tax=Amycolatopsis sp. A133 TaxID=3064472 RepID=UPI0027EF9C10|nr:hypothetical protein [Amycolatopsis sp. A133]MDQ7810860.1 hypothetical protein [Amycolatopsis sp. A133]
MHPRGRRTRTGLGLDSDLATVIDEVEAYQAVLAAIGSLDPGRGAAFRRTTRWLPGRRLRDPLSHPPLAIVEASKKAPAALPEGDLGTTG